MKLSRSDSKATSDSANQHIDVDQEISAMELTSHEYITRLYATKKTKDGYYCFITELVPEHDTLDKYFSKKITGQSQNSTLVSLDVLLHDLARYAYCIARALQYMHDECGLCHMDIKPANILISHNGHPYLTDLGFARPMVKNKPSNGEQIYVGFTYAYAHKDLLDSSLRIGETQAKALNRIPADKISPKYDLYAFGRTLLHILNIFRKSYGGLAQQKYTFRFLHLLATLLLDGKNVKTASDSSEELFLTEIYGDIDQEMVEKFKIITFDKVVDRLERLFNKVSLESIIPELDRYYVKKVNHGTGFFNVTKRVQVLLAHKIMRRLKGVKQLGVADEVYPSAVHNRKSHTLGVAENTGKYILALYYDSENPVFKVLVDYSHVTLAMLYALVHDIGQSDFSHELDELDSQKRFSHTKIVDEILRDNKCVDFISFKNILEGKQNDGWGIDINDLLLLFSKKDKAHPMLHLIRTIIDGPLDADKTDYVIRDSKFCNVPYGNGVDIERLISCLTCIPSKGDVAESTLFLGVKEKGIASCRSLLEARSKLYESVYLHHTVRAIKSMILTACNDGFLKSLSAIDQAIGGKKSFGQLFSSEILMELFISHVFSQDISLASIQIDTIKKKINELFSKIEKSATLLMEQHDFNDKSSSFFYYFMNDIHKNLMQNALQRKVYQRISSFPLDKNNMLNFKETFSWSNRAQVIEKIETALVDTIVKKSLNNRALSESLSIHDIELNKVIQELKKNNILIIADVPLRSLDPHSTEIIVLDDVDRRIGAIQNAKKWHMEECGQIMQTFRFYCHPNLHRYLYAFMNQREIDSIINDKISFWKRA